MKPSRSHRARDPRASRFLATLADALAPGESPVASGSEDLATVAARLAPVLEAAGADPQQLDVLLETVEDLLDELEGAAGSTPGVNPPPLPRPCDPHFFG